jgi:hypothetical protein
MRPESAGDMTLERRIWWRYLGKTAYGSGAPQRRGISSAGSQTRRPQEPHLSRKLNDGGATVRGARYREGRVERIGPGSGESDEP